MPRQEPLDKFFLSPMDLFNVDYLPYRLPQAEVCTPLPSIPRCPAVAPLVALRVLLRGAMPLSALLPQAVVSAEMALCDDLRELRDVLVLAYRPTFPSPLPLVRRTIAPAPTHSPPNQCVCVRARVCVRACAGVHACACVRGVSVHSCARARALILAAFSAQPRDAYCTVLR